MSAPLLVPSSAFGLHEQAVAVIVNHPHLRQRNVRLKTSGEQVTIEGTVQTYFEKQIAQEALKRVAGISSIENDLEVCWDA